MTLVVKFMPQASHMTENSDPRPLHRRAIAQTETAVAAVSADQLPRTPPPTSS